MVMIIHQSTKYEEPIPSNEDLLYEQFKKYHRQFMILLAESFFDTKRGSITVHFDENGAIRKVERSTITFHS